MDTEASAAGPDTAAIYKVAYDEAARALSEQLTLIDSFRTRAGLLLSAAAITTSFLSARALAAGSLSFASGAALTSFVAVAVVSLAILWPRAWELSANPAELIGDYIEVDGSPASLHVGDLYRDLAQYMHRSHDENLDRLAELMALFQIASCMLTIETVLWITSIASRM
jgi:hypothetical protein